MTQHYYTAKPTTTSQKQRWTYSLREHLFHFYSDNGVFSKNTVDFGSALLIETLDSTWTVHKALDVGCGYGPIGLAVARLFPQAEIEMVDMNERAIELAVQNSALNDVSNVCIYQSDCYTQVATSDFDLIVSNPPIRAGKEVVHRIIEQAFDRLRMNGRLVIVIQKKQGAPSAEKKMREIFGDTTLLARSKGYWILESVKE